MTTQLKGEVSYLYAFDVADEIRTEKIHKILSKKPMPYGIQREHTIPKDVPFYRPLTIDLHRDAWKLNGNNVQPVVRIYDVGVVSIMISVPFTVSELKKLMHHHQPILDNQTRLDKAAHTLCSEVVHSLAEYLIRGSDSVEVPEAYTVFSLNDIEDGKSVEDWTIDHRREIAGLLAETNPIELSTQQIDEIFRYNVSFTKNDMTIIDWDAAMVIDLTGPSTDAIHVLELANLQLEELVLMDKRIDKYLDRTYEVLEKKRFSFLGPPRKYIAMLRRFRMDVAKITDEVSNISKFFGDWYLARIYMGARDRFHLPTWRESIQNRLSILDNLYEVFRSEVTETRMLSLEILIVLLFVVDLLVLLLKH